MKVTEVTYTKRFNTGKYEHEEYTVTASIDEDDDAKESIAELKQLVVQGHGGEIDVDQDKDEAEEEESEEQESKKSRGSKAKPKDEDESEEEESEEEEPSEEEAEEEEEKPKAAAKKKFRSKDAAYDRQDPLHKKLVGEILDSKFKGWNKKGSDLAKKAGKASQELDGEDFLDNDGEVVPEFRSKLLKLMGGAAKKK